MELERIASKCLEKEASNRYQHVDEVLVDLGAVKQAPTPKPRKSLFKYAIPASVVLLAAVLLIIFNLFQSENTPDERTGPVRLAVLPFENLGAPEDEYFADGITDEITSKLAVIPGLAVISRTSAKLYKNTDKGLREIGRELGADVILEGTIRWDKRGEREKVRITPQLINVSDDIHLWAENYEREIEEIFAVQADIASRIAEALDITLLASDRQILETRPTENLDAYQAYLRGLDLKRKFSGVDLRLAIQMFERAVEFDPEFAVGYAALSQAHSLMVHFGIDRSEERISLARAAVDKALELQPGLPEAHMALGCYYYWCHRDYEPALAELAVAGKGLPNDSRILRITAFIWRRQGKFEAAADRLEGVFELSPQDASLPLEIGEIYERLRRYAEADRYFDLAISLAPDEPATYGLKARNYISWRGDLKRARKVLEQAPGEGHDAQGRLLRLWYLERNYEAILDFVSSASEPSAWHYGWAADTYRAMGKPELAHASYDSARVILEKELDARDVYWLHQALGIAYAGVGRKEDAIREGKRAVELYPVSTDAFTGPALVQSLAVIYTMVGEYDAALDELEYLLSIPSLCSVQELRLDPDYDPLREHPRFQALLEKYAID